MNDWQEVRLEEISSQRKGINYKAEDYADEYSGHPFITIKCFIKGGGYDPSGIKYLSGNGMPAKADILEAGDILFSVTDLTRAGDIVGSPLKVPHFGARKSALASMDCMKITPHSDKCGKGFLYHRLMLFDIRRQMVAYSAGSTVLHLETKKVPTIKIKIPVDVKVQQKIATILSTIDRTIEKTEALIDKYQQLKHGLMHDLFTHGIAANGKLRPPRSQAPELYKKTPIGWIPKEWDLQTLKNILSDKGGYIQTGPFGSQLHAYEYLDDGVPVVMPQDINQGKITNSPSAKISEQRASGLIRHRLKFGDIIIARRGELSRAAAIKQEQVNWVCGTGCFLMRLGATSLDPIFFAYAFREDFIQRQVAGLAVGTTMLSLNTDIMHSLYFPILSTEEQGRISQAIESIEKRLATLRDNRTNLQKQKSGLMQDLLTGKVQVKMEENEANHV